MKTVRISFIALLLLALSAASFAAEPRAKVVIVGMVHGHVNGWLHQNYHDDIELVGIYEPNKEVAKKYRERFSLKESQFFNDLEAMLDQQKPQAAWVFTSTYDHEKVVEACAKRGIDVIVEKPLAVDLASANRMAALAREHDIHLLTNLETSWYPSLQEAIQLADEEKTLGDLTKIVSHFGHMGPVEIGCPQEFLDWLTDPVLNGGGASADFGCYGANIITHLMKNKRPLSVTAVFQSHKPDIYPKVDDDATIILNYPGMQGIIQASWDWPYSRKDVHLYGRSGVIRTINDTNYDIRLLTRKPPVEKKAKPDSPTATNPIKYFTAVIRGEIDPDDSLSALETNLIAVEIIDAARKSAQTGQTVKLEP